MRLTSTTLPLLALAATSTLAADQHPLASLYDQLASYIPAAYRPATSPFESWANSASHAAEEAAAKAAAKNVTPLTLENWRATLSKSTTSRSHDGEVWWVYITGGNKTCHGLCGPANKAWNDAALRLAAIPHSPSLATINCDKTPVLCNAWAATPPSVWHITLPKTVGTPTDIRIVDINATSTTKEDFLEIHTKGSASKAPLYTGLFHPFDGLLAKLQLTEVFGYVLWGFSLFPSWAYMLAISFLSRSFMSKRTQPQGPAAPRAPVQGAPAGDGLR